jgi:hypothetical protein
MESECWTLRSAESPTLTDEGLEGDPFLFDDLLDELLADAEDELLDTIETELDPLLVGPGGTGADPTGIGGQIGSSATTAPIDFRVGRKRRRGLNGGGAGGAGGTGGFRGGFGSGFRHTSSAQLGLNPDNGFAGSGGLTLDGGLTFGATLPGLGGGWGGSGWGGLPGNDPSGLAAFTDGSGGGIPNSATGIGGAVSDSGTWISGGLFDGEAASGSGAGENGSGTGGNGDGLFDGSGSGSPASFATPEPGSLLIWSLMGGGGLWAARRRKRSAGT